MTVSGERACDNCEWVFDALAQCHYCNQLFCAQCIDVDAHECPAVLAEPEEP